MFCPKIYIINIFTWHKNLDKINTDTFYRNDYQMVLVFVLYFPYWQSILNSVIQNPFFMVNWDHSFWIWKATLIIKKWLIWIKIIYHVSVEWRPYTTCICTHEPGVISLLKVHPPQTGAILHHSYCEKVIRLYFIV